MAAPGYATDLLEYGSVTGTTGWAEATNMTDTDGSGEVDPDLAIYGVECYSESQRKSGLGSLVYTGTEPTWTSGTTHYFVWFKFFAPNSLSTKSAGGIRMLVGNTSANYYGWYVDGSDTYPYGGWLNYVVDPTKTDAATQTQGTPNGTWNTLGIGCNLLNGISKGNSMTIDIMRYGRGLSEFTNGDLANGYATFAGFAALNDAPLTGRWGLIQDVGGSYLYKGLMSLGTTGTAVDMRDSNVNITIDNTEMVRLPFNRIEVHNASSNVEWTSVNFTALSTESPGQFEMIDNATVSMVGCSFLNMDTFIFQSNGSALASTFQGCKAITAGGGTFTGSNVYAPSVTGTNAAGFIWDETTDPDGNIDNMNFTSGSTSHHAIYFGDQIPSSITLRGVDFQGFNPSNNQTNSTLYFADTGGTITVNLVLCSGDISYTSAGATINLVADPVTTKITTKDADTQLPISGVTAFAWVTNGVNFPYLDSVTITGATTTATVHHVGHGLSTNDTIWIQGAEQENYVGAYDITVINDDYYSYTTAQTIVTSPATGTITATFCFFNGFTDANGEISDSRVVSNNQPFAYRCRKGTESPLYKTGAGTETVSSTIGKEITVNLVSDE